MLQARAPKARTSSRIAKNEARNVQVFPNDECFNGTKLKRLEGINDTEAVFARILADLIKVLLDQLLLLDKLDIGQGFRGKVDSLDNTGSMLIQ
jgi:hypothetical protein